MKAVVRHILLFVVLMLSVSVSAQELNCRVEINSDQISGTDKTEFEALQQAINEYMNSTIFSTAQYAANEKIECVLFLTITEKNDQSYVGNLQVQATRPVYNTAYTTTTLNFRDNKVEFNYQLNEPLVFSQSQMESQLTAILNFYAYLILAIDSDTFAPRGGEPFYDMLKQIVQWAQSSGESGWKAFEDTKNRSAVLSSLTDASTSTMRDLLYQYHRRGLDEMFVSPDKGRASITESLESVKKVHDVAPMSVALSMFHDAKLDELVNIYSQAGQEERTKVYELLEPIYPTDSERLQKIRKGKEK